MEEESQKKENTTVPNLEENKNKAVTLQRHSRGGAPKGNRNAAKIGKDLKYQSYMSKTTRGFFEEFFELRFGRKARSEAELVHLARQIAENAIKSEMVQEFERHQPGRVAGSSGETF